MLDKQAQVLLHKAAEDEKVMHWASAPDGPFGFHAQQAVEKLLKALLSQLGIEYKRTHDLAYLIGLLETAGETMPSVATEFARLESFAVVHRYDEVPDYEVLDRRRAKETVRILREHVATRVAALSAAP